jgi:parallel beta-helix repeat protein
MKAISWFLIAVLLIGTVVYFNVKPAEAEGIYIGATIYIRADGSVDPSDVPILNTFNTTYTFTNSILVDALYGIVVERDNIVLDGSGYTLSGSNESDSVGIYLSGRENVTIQNLHITTFHRGIRLLSSFNSSIVGNTVTGATYEGIRLYSSSNNLVERNNLTGNYYGIWLFSSSNNNEICENKMTENIYDGIRLFSASNNRIIRNNITANNVTGMTLYILSDNNSICENVITGNSQGFRISGSSGNMIVHNDIIENTYVQVIVEDTSQNIWDDGYPSGGNYWSDYLGVDVNSDGIGDSSYIIDSNNADNYPLIKPYNLKVLGDINHDGAVDIFDIVIIALAFSSIPSDPNWDVIADINSDGIVDIFDLVVVALHFGETI